MKKYRNSNTKKSPLAVFIFGILLKPLPHGLVRGIIFCNLWRFHMDTNLERKIQERAVLVGLNADCFTQAETATDASLEELEALLETAGGFCTAKILQNRHTPDPHSFIGEGKAQEVRMLVEATASTMVIFDN